MTNKKYAELEIKIRTQDGSGRFFFYQPVNQGCKEGDIARKTIVKRKARKREREERREEREKRERRERIKRMGPYNYCSVRNNTEFTEFLQYLANQGFLDCTLEG